LYKIKKKIDFKDFSSQQLKKPENIKLIEKLEITLDLEYDKFVHLKIKDANDTRWEVPEKDVLDKDYLLNKNDNKIAMSRYSKIFDSQFFYIELLINDTVGNENINDDKDPDNIDVEKDMDANDNNENENDDNIINEYFGFRLMTQENEEFYSFTTTKNFLYSDTYINFESKLTSDNIYGFGERTHDFKLNEGIYTILPYDCEERNMMMAKEE